MLCVRMSGLTSSLYTIGDSIVTTAAVKDIISMRNCDVKYSRYFKCFMVCRMIIRLARNVDRGIASVHIMNKTMTVCVLVHMCVAKF